jgi:hypothetical protein
MMAITLAGQIEQWLRWGREAREAAREVEKQYCRFFLEESRREEDRIEDR